MPLLSIDREGAVAIVTIDNPPVNALSRDLRQALFDAAEALDADASVNAVVLACAGRTFIAGADVNEFGRPTESPLPPAPCDDPPRAAALRPRRHGDGCAGLRQRRRA